MKKNLTELVFIVDRSGSMGGLESDTIGGINATLAKNLGDFPPTHCAYLDSNNVPDLVEFVIGKGWCEQVGEGASGFCTYPFVEFTDEFLDEICVTEEG